MTKHIVIIGHGAIGLLWAHQLTAAQHRVTLLSRRKNLPLPAQTFVAIDSKRTVNQFTFQHELPYDADLVLVTTKSYQVCDALAPFLNVITVPIMLLHNGMGAIDELDLSPEQKVMLATTTHGALRSEQTLTHTGMGNTTIGNYQQMSPKELADWQYLLNSALPSVDLHDHIVQPLLLKLAINCVINPLTAIAQCKNGELLAQRYQPKIDALISEIQHVIMHLDKTWPYTEISLKTIIMNVAKATSDNYSSMAQDVKYKRQTEIKFINGYLVRCGKKFGVTMTTNENLISTLLKL